jgi:acyl carrier protein
VESVVFIGRFDGRNCVSENSAKIRYYRRGKSSSLESTFVERVSRALWCMDPIAITQRLIVFVNADIMAPDRPVAADTNLRAEGVDSMALLKIFVYVEAEFGCWLPDENLEQRHLSTLGDIANRVYERQAVAR